MEEEIDLLLNEIAEPTGKPTFIIVIESVITLLACVLGFLANTFIIYAILRSNRINSRTNLLILNWAINNAIFLIVSPVLYGNHYIELLEQHWVLCIFLNTDIATQSLLIIFSFLLVSDYSIRSKYINIKLLIFLMYIFVICIWLVMMYICTSKYYPNVIYSFYANAIAFLLLTLTIIYKQIKNFATQKTETVSKDSVFRLGVVTNFVFLTAVSVIFIILHRFSEYFESGISVSYLSSVFMLIYLIRNDILFKIRFVEFCKCNREDRVTSSLNFVEDDSDDDGASVRFLNESRTDEDVFVV